MNILDQLIDPSDCPPVSHPDKPLFAPTSKPASLRQRIWNYLQQRPEEKIPIKDIARELGEKYRDVYAAAKMLCNKHLAKRYNKVRYKKSKTGEEVYAGTTITIQFIPVFGSKKAEGLAGKNTWK